MLREPLQRQVQRCLGAGAPIAVAISLPAMLAHQPPLGARGSNERQADRDGNRRASAEAALDLALEWLT